MAVYDSDKHQMKIALVGVRPADQVLIKGYFRVLLRLDVELIWAAATDKNINLFMINDEFRSAASIAKLLDANKTVPTLYVKRDDMGSGGIQNDTLTIPLKQVNLLNDWLDQHVPSLNAPTQSAAKPQSAEQETPRTPERTVNLDNVLEMINIIHTRPKAVFELVEDDRVIALVDAERQRLWVKGSISKLSPQMRFRVYGGQLPPASEAKDASQWFWLLACHNPDTLLPLIEHTTRYRLRFWARPPANLRRELLGVMTAIEGQALNLPEITKRSGVSAMTVKKALAALLFSGNLTAESYQNLKDVVARTTTAKPVITPTPAPVVEEPVVHTQEQQDKFSFLSKIRKKLGL